MFKLLEESVRDAHACRSGEVQASFVLQARATGGLKNYVRDLCTN